MMRKEQKARRRKTFHEGGRRRVEWRAESNSRNREKERRPTQRPINKRPRSDIYVDDEMMV